MSLRETGLAERYSASAADRLTYASFAMTVSLRTYPARNVPKDEFHPRAVAGHRASVKRRDMPSNVSVKT